MIETVIHPVDDAPIGEQGGEAAPARLEQVLGAADIEEALVLSGEARVGKIFGGRGTADRDGDTLAILCFQLAIGGRDVAAHRVGPGGGMDKGAGLRGTLRQDRQIVNIAIVQQPMQPRPGVRLAQSVGVSLRGQGEAVGHAHSGSGERAIHLPERRVLAADQRNVFETDAVEPADIPRWCVHDGKGPATNGSHIRPGRGEH